MGAAILDRKSWGPPSWIGSRGGRHLGSEVVGAAILDRKSWGPPSWTGSHGGRHLGSDVVTSLTLKWHLYYYDITQYPASCKHENAVEISFVELILVSHLHEQVRFSS